MRLKQKRQANIVLFDSVHDSNGEQFITQFRRRHSIQPTDVNNLLIQKLVISLKTTPDDS